MPQDSIFPTDPRFDGIRIEFTEVPFEQGQVWNLVITRRRPSGDWWTVHASRVSGYMVDFVTTYASEAVSAFFFGEDRDLARALAGVQKVARAHARRHALLH